MRILLIGADGQLGSELVNLLPASDLVPLTMKDLDITDKKQTSRLLEQHQPEIVINTAAFHRVDDCEVQEATAFAVNTIGVKHLAESCRRLNSVLVHFSTDYVFDGQKRTPYTEDDTPNPQSIYGLSKYAGEQCLKYLLEKYFIIRTAGLYGRAGCLGKGGANFVDRMLKKAEVETEIKVVKDEIVAPTYAVDLAKKVCELMPTKQYGLYHIVNHGQCSWAEFAAKIIELAGKKVTVKPVSSAEYKAKAKRPPYSVLQNARLAKLGLDDLPDWPDSLARYLLAK